jgi:hypothetical protein
VPAVRVLGGQVVVSRELTFAEAVEVEVILWVGVKEKSIGHNLGCHRHGLSLQKQNHVKCRQHHLAGETELDYAIN